MFRSYIYAFMCGFLVNATLWRISINQMEQIEYPICLAMLSLVLAILTKNKAT